ncbi:hypothetical protein D0N36_14295 [Hymenobacter lapidiphilus]|uniref:hypothetical protein n=1 Tax=Hymenobacter sp. CCM 8763 TaxID=2303334 RepID=UPI000E346EEA|nr:hypothetical protein [Hymenobacter sp. CCM 8763]RFP64356.1 hypothetical protein D0N36_14295 [Hymenobacter sp. CCM 8763]
MARKAYCTLEALEEIFDDPVTHADLYHILRDYHDVVLNLPEEDLELEILQNQYLRTLCKRGVYQLAGETNFYECLPEEFMACTAGGLFILDESPAVCADLSTRYGACVLSLRDPAPSHTLTHHYYRQMAHQDSFTESSPTGSSPTDIPATSARQGWPALLAPMGRLPMNSLLLVDNYLFTNLHEGRKNLLSLLDGLLPPRLDVEFHLLLVTTNPRNVLSPAVLADLFDQIRTHLNRPYPLLLGLLTHGGQDRRFHRRAWVSNYHFGSSDRGFVCFDEQGRVKAHNDIRVQGAFRDARTPYSDVPWRSMVLELQSAAALRLHNEQLGGLMATNLLYGNCNNRLLQLVN